VSEHRGARGGGNLEGPFRRVKRKAPATPDPGKFVLPKRVLRRCGAALASIPALCPLIRTRDDNWENRLYGRADRPLHGRAALGACA